MTLKTVPVTGILYNADGSVAANASVVATLTVVDTDASIVVPSQVAATADSNGVFTLNLWPNSRGVNGSQYRVRAQMPGALPGVLLVNLLITVPDSDPAVLVPISTITNRTGPAALSDAKAAMLAAQGFALQAAAVLSDPGFIAVRGDLAHIDAVAADLTRIDAVALDLPNIDAVAGDKANIDSVAANVTPINTNAANIAAIQGASGSATSAAGSAAMAQAFFNRIYLGAF